jgi:CheY-like chemotaxis protein
MSLTGLSILVLEDEPIIAMTLEDLLAEGGAEALVAHSLTEAERIAARQDFDAALLDVNVGKATSYAFAEALRERGVPIVFATGYGSALHPEAFADAPTVAKPYNLPDIESALTQALC